MYKNVEEHKEKTDITQKDSLEQGQTLQQEAESSNKAKLLTALFNEEDGDDAELKQLKDIIQTLSFDGMTFKKHRGLFFILLVGVMISITNRYQTQQQMIEEEMLLMELQDWRFRSMTRNSELTFRCRQSQLERELKAHGDTTLMMSTTPPYLLESN